LQQLVLESDGEQGISVTRLARELGVTARTLRFYEDRGLITPLRQGNARIYTLRDRARMILILRGKRLGFSLREIKEYLDLYAKGQTGAEQLRVLQAGVAKRLESLLEQQEAIELTIAELQDIADQTAAALAATERQRAAK
jgi:DNA-binding transcriptional MerR regulator